MITDNRIGLKISFDYLSGNDILLEFIKHIADKHRIEGFLERKGDQIEIIVSGSLENIQEFSKELGEKLPYSIFMSDASTQVIESIPPSTDKFQIKGEINILPQNLSICPECLKELFDSKNRRFYFPFISCNYCGNHYSYLYEYPFKREKTVFKFFQPCEECKKEYENKKSRRYRYPLISCHRCLTPVYLKKGENERYGFDSEKTVGAINTAAGIIKKGNLLRIYTSNGEKVIGIINEENSQKVREILNMGRKPLTVMFTHFGALEKYLILSQYEFRALGSQEKPVVYLKPSDSFIEKSFVSEFDFIKAKLPDDPILLLLSATLREEDIEYLLIENITEEYQKTITEFELNADLPVINKQKDMNLIIIDRYTIIEDGEKGVLPNIIKSKSTGNLSIHGSYAALDLGNGEYLIDRKEKIINQLNDFVDSINSFNYSEYENINIPSETKRKFEDYQGAILSVAAENSILDESFVGIYFSHDSDNNLIAVKQKTKPLSPLIKIKPLRIYEDFYRTVNYILSQIKKSSEEGKRLIDKFCSRFTDFKPEEPEGEYRLSSNITAIFNAISILTGIFPHKDISFHTEPYLYIREKAINFKGKKGVRIDYYLQEENGEFFLDWVKIIQSALSYKLADTDDDMLAFSVFEGFTDWIINEVSLILSKLKIDSTILSGNLLTDPLIGGKLISSFSKNSNYYINRRLPVDNVNIAFGGIFV
ncbi:hydrogenase maturation protein HypF [Persephonella hydrogeniphila]|uniref:Hydrogenase maturation protein HypF n=1 Tax=Persephonella hydrogeniphila TaxID=198703 RepID=A0A285NH80_9AQUI|nr:acylphosphatase [Persephonella hydrogeniphila]SNZ07011.1 hydrogenase maturation protein HypF [Persephonella hydrogeniphila]